MPRAEGKQPLSTVARIWVATWTASMLLWLLLTSTVLPSEAIGGLGASAIAATAFTLVRVAERPLFRPRRRWFRAGNLIWMPVQVVLDTGTVFHEAIRRSLGGKRSRSAFVKVPIHVDRERATRNARDLLTTVRVSVTPNTYVVGIDEEEGTMLVHQLVRTDPASVQDLLKPG